MFSKKKTLRRKIQLAIDAYPRLSRFVGAGLFASVCIIAAMVFESMFGQSQAKLYSDWLGTLGLLMLIGIMACAPICIAHWIWKDY